MVAVLLLAVQAILLVGPLPGDGALQSKTPDIHPKGFRSVTTEEAPELLNNDVYEVGFAEGSEALRGTGAHPLFSLDRDDWVRVRDLQVGERLQTAEGAVTVEALEKVRGVHRVYNLEVEGDHEYLVGEAGVRAHNTCDIDVLSRVAGSIDRNGLTNAGRAAQKHGSRAGSRFPGVSGKAADINRAGQDMVDDILTHPGTTRSTKTTNAFGDVQDFFAPDGRGVRFGADGSWIGFIER